MRIELTLGYIPVINELTDISERDWGPIDIIPGSTGRSKYSTGGLSFWSRSNHIPCQLSGQTIHIRRVLKGEFPEVPDNDSDGPGAKSYKYTTQYIAGLN